MPRGLDHDRRLHPAEHDLIPQLGSTVRNMQTREAVLVQGLLVLGHARGHRHHRARGPGPGLGLINDVQGHHQKK